MVGTVEFREMQTRHLRVVAEDRHAEIGPAQISGENQGRGFGHWNNGFRLKADDLGGRDVGVGCDLGQQGIVRS